MRTGLSPAEIPLCLEDDRRRHAPVRQVHVRKAWCPLAEISPNGQQPRIRFHVRWSIPLRTTLAEGGRRLERFAPICNLGLDTILQLAAKRRPEYVPVN